MSDESTAIGERVRNFYEEHPYPPPPDDLAAYGRAWDDRRRRADAHLFWPGEPFRDDRSILVAGCGTAQAARYAMRWPRAQVLGIDVSAASIASTEELKRKHRIDNLELRQIDVERVAELGRSFEYVVCTGVLHHLADPDQGLRALRDVLAPGGALHVMVYAPYGRAGVYLIQEYCRRIGLGHDDRDIRELAASLKALPADHPLVPLLRHSPDFQNRDALADALLHPCDRAYSVPQFHAFLRSGGFRFGRWFRQAPYLPWCGALASYPHHAKLAALSLEAQHAAIELFRGTMVRHAAIAYRDDERTARTEVEFGSDGWERHVPVPLPDTKIVRERLPAGAAAVLINPNHTYTDLYLPVDESRLRLFSALDGKRSAGEICGEADPAFGRRFLEELWRWDHIVVDTSRGGAAQTG